MSSVSAAPRGRGVRLAGTGMAIPAKVLTNDDLAGMVDTNDEWIAQRTGIRRRHLVEGGLTTRDLARQALQGALADAGMTPRQIDFLICATITPEMACPATGVRLASELGAAPAGAMDISAACSGFVYGMNLAAAMLTSPVSSVRTVAVVGCETLSTVTDWTDRRTCVLFGDGAGAAVFTAGDDARQGCLYQSMASDGGLWKEIYLPRVQADVPEGAGFSGHFNTLQMNGREVYKFAVHTFQRTVEQALEAARLTIGDLAMVVAHQSNARILESARDKLGLPADKLYINIDRYGNTSAASVPICLHELRSSGRVKAGDLVLFVAIGGGMTWASSLWRL